MERERAGAIRTLRRPAIEMCAALAALPCAAADDPRFDVAVRPVLERYCIECHGGDEPRGDLDFEGYASGRREPFEPDDWQLAREELSRGAMPPKGRPRPSLEELAGFLGWIDARFGPATNEPATDPGRPVLRRLNHAEYENTVRDLFGVEFHAREWFPPDEIGHGFDTEGGALSISELAFERYLEAAEHIAARAIVIEDPAHAPSRRIAPDELEGDGEGREEVWMLTANGDAGVRVSFPRTGEYALRAGASAQQAGPDPARMALCIEGAEVARFDVSAPRNAPGTHEARLRVEEGERRVAARFLNDYYRPDDPDPANRDRNLLVAWLEIEGPLDPAPVSRFQTELFERFGEELGDARYRTMLEHLARRAWRRPVSALELDRLERLASSVHGLERDVQLAVQAILASPSFLYRAEPDPPQAEAGAARALNGYELAVRLSYFLWSTTPDEELEQRAASGDLLQPEVLQSEMARLLRSERSRAFSARFATQWLQIGRLERVAPDPQRFPLFGPDLRAAMQSESVLFFDAVLREDRSAWDLIEGDFGFANDVLATHYGIEGVEGAAMQRVSLAALPRRGVLGQASVLTVTSDPTRTSPVARGKWILQTLLGAPPPAPPPGVGVLDESDEAVAAASLRERLEQHRVDPACSACHAAMDPLGFGLENFDAIGAWRESDGSFPIDAAGELPDGRTFRGPIELAALLRRDDAFLRCLVEKLFVYALGRGLERGDRATIDDIMTSLDPARPTLRGMIESVVLSRAFRERRVEPKR